MNARRAAWSLLCSSALAPLRELEERARALDLDPRDRGLARKLLGTELRRRGTLRALLRAFASGRPRRELALHLHLGLVQLFFLDRVPDHAAIDETVEQVSRTLGARQAGYANAVLRAAQRARREGESGDPRRDLVGRGLHLSEPVFRDPALHPLLWAEDALSLPAALFRRWARRYGEERARELALLALEEPALSVRVARGDPAALRAELARGGAAVRPSRRPDLLLFAPEEAETVLASEAFARGDLVVQGEAALRAAELVGARPGERLLDLCAAPGGKTAVLAAAGAKVVACDVDAGRLERARRTLERLGLADRVELAVRPAGEALPGGDYDGVLVDAPCSNTGVLSARPEARWRFGPGAQRSLVELQGKLLEDAARVVRPGGRLVWSTCSLEPEENERLIARFLGAHPGWQLEQECETFPAAPPGPIDGGRAARLRSPAARKA